MNVPALFALLATSFKAITAHPLDAIDLDNSLNAAQVLEAAGFKIIPTTFTGPWGSNGEDLALTGTIQEVVEQVKKLNPNYDFGLPEHHSTSQSSSGGDPDPDDDMVDLQAEIEVANADCSKGEWANLDRIKQGIDYLRVVPKDHAVMKGKGCGRVSCSNNSAIYLCWEPRTDRQEYHRTWNYVADYAVTVTDIVCPRLGGKHLQTKGKIWDPMGMGVLITADKC